LKQVLFDLTWSNYFCFVFVVFCVEWIQGDLTTPAVITAAQQLLSPSVAAELATQIFANTTLPLEKYGEVGHIPLLSAQAHASVVDTRQMAVSISTSVSETEIYIFFHFFVRYYWSVLPFSDAKNIEWRYVNFRWESLGVVDSCFPKLELFSTMDSRNFRPIWTPT
jgi:hypothetical protein